MKIIVVCGLTCKLYTHIVVRNLRPQSDNNWDNRSWWLWCEDHMCSWSVNALLRCSIKRSTLITSSFPWGPAANGLVGQKMSCKFLIASMYDYIRNTCLWLLSTRMLYLYLSAIAHDEGQPLGCGPIFTDSRDLWRGTRMNTKNAMNTKNTMNKSKANTHTQDTHRLSSLARFTNSIESQERDSKSRIPCERLICLE
jgi:hypothetical protein